jgi:tetraacyldisaccharide 4'-kinase
MRAPAFWEQRGPVALALAPLGLITRAVTARRVRRFGFEPGIPVVCVGNASAGGSGKTIVVLDLLGRLPGRPFALTRGYRGRLKGPVLVDLKRHSAADVGDEALLLAAVAPTIVAQDRGAGARLALAEGATAIVMDDGLQNPTLRKTCSFLVIDGGYGFGNGLLLPAGPLREPIAAAAARVQAAIVIGEDTTSAAAALPPSLPILRAQLTPHCATSLANQRVIAFAGTGRPEKFFASVSQLGANITAKIPYPDHHIYTQADATHLLTTAARHNAKLVTTTKDNVKLPPTLRAATTPITVTLTWTPPGLDRFVVKQGQGALPPGPPPRPEALEPGPGR